MRSGFWKADWFPARTRTPSGNIAITQASDLGRQRLVRFLDRALARTRWT